MTKKRSLVGKARHLLVGLGLALAVGLVPSTAQAVTGGSASELESVGNLEGNQVYFGNYTMKDEHNPGGSYSNNSADGPLPWYVVRTPGNGENKDAEGRDAITLWSGKTHMGQHIYDPSGHHSWSGSQLCHWLNNTGNYTADADGFLKSAFDTSEQQSISLYGDEVDGISINQKILLPSVSEMGSSSGTGSWDINQTSRNFGDYYWLRSLSFGASIVVYVYLDGYVDPYGGYVDNDHLVVRPALKIPLDSILFTSSATSGSGAAKSEVDVGDGLQAVTKVAEDARTTTPLKLTVIDKDNQKLTVSKLSTLGNSVTVNYKDATTGTNQSLSAILEDADGKVKYYGKLAALTDGTNVTGSASFSVNGLTAGTYTLKVFSELLNGDNKTDVASEPLEYALNITDQGMAQLPDEGVLTGEVIAFDGYEWYVIGGDNSSALRVLLKSDKGKTEDGKWLPYPLPTGSSFGDTNKYADSRLKTTLDKAYIGIENDKEKEVVQSRELKSGPNSWDEDVNNLLDTVGGDAVPQAHYWPLSSYEASRLPKEILEYKGMIPNIESRGWWLRSPGKTKWNVAIVYKNGSVYLEGHNQINTTFVGRPAFDLPLDSLLFTSSASGESGGVKGSVSTDSADWKTSASLVEAGEPMKYTIINKELSLDVAEDGETFYFDKNAAAKELTLNYSSATHTRSANDGKDYPYTGNYLSVLLSDGKTEQYLKLKQLTSAEGDISFELPANLEEGEYTLKIFNEEINETTTNFKYTDFASKPVELFVEIDAPNVDKVEPSGEDPLIKIDHSEFTVTFDKKMDVAKTGTIKLEPIVDDPSKGPVDLTNVEVTAQGDEKIVTAKLPANTTLAYGTTYKYVINDFYGDNGALMKQPASEFTFKTMSRETKPTAKIAYVEEQLTELDANADYKIGIVGEETAEFTANADGNIPVKEEWIGKVLSIIKKGIQDQTYDSEELNVEVKQAATPNVTANPATTGKADGEIFGVTTEMEYRKGDDAQWTTYKDEEFKGLAKDTKYTFRMKSKDDPDGYFYSKPVEIVITESRLPTSIEDVVAFDGYEWYVIGNGQSGVYPNANHLTLLLKSRTNKNPASGVANNQPYVADTIFGGNNEYAGSDLRTQMKAAHGLIENDRESKLVKVRELTGGSGNLDTGTYDANKVAGGDVDDAKFWPLSVAEANMLNNGIRGYPNYWWLRSPGYRDNHAAYVYDVGIVYPRGTFVDMSICVVRPAFDLPLNSLLFTSSTSGASGDEWQNVEDLKPAVGETNKFTMVDPSIQSKLALDVTSSEEVFIASDETTKKVTITYKDATFDSGSGRASYVGNSLSALLTDKDGKRHYLRVKDLDSAEGTAEITLPDGLAVGDYTLQVFNEEVNGELYTNLTSKPEEVKVTVKNRAEVAKVEPNDGSGKVSVENGKELAITFNQAMDTTPGNEGTVKLKYGQDNSQVLTATFKEWKANSDDKIAVYKVDGLTYGTVYTYELSGFKDAKDVPVTDYGHWKFTTIGKEPTPDVQIGYEEEQLTGFDSTAQYTITIGNGEPINVASRDSLKIEEDWFDKDVSIVRKGDDVEKVDSDAQTFKIKERPDAPAVNMTPASSISAEDGTIEGVTPAMEYRTKLGEAEFSEWKPCEGTSITGLATGTEVEIRIAATATSFRSLETKETIKAMPTVEAVTPATAEEASGVLSITFTKEMKTAGKVSLDGQELNTEGAKWSNNNKTYEIPYANLEGGKNYPITIEGFVDTDDYKMVTDESKELTTAAKPKVESTDPDTTEKAPITTSELRITFDKEMKTAGTVTLTGGTQALETEFDSWDVNTAIFKVSGLEYDKTYTYEIKDFVDTKGFGMAEDKSRKFTTIAQADQPNVGIDYADEKLTGFESGATYDIKIGETLVLEDQTGITDLSLGDKAWFGQLISITRKEDGKDASEAQTFTIPTRHAAPVVTVTPASKIGESNGSMSAAGDNLEYAGTDNEWKTYNGPITGLASGDAISFRTKHREDQAGEFASGHFRSAPVTETMFSKPSLTSTAPTSEAPVQGSLVLEFDRTMDQATIGTVRIQATGTDFWQILTPAATPWSNDAKQYTVTYGELTAGQTYKLEVTGFKDTNGEAMAMDIGRTLVIASKPTITTVTPSGTDRVDIDRSEVDITFSTPMDEAPGTVVLTYGENQTISATFSEWLDDQTAVYKIAGLEYGTTYAYSINGFTSQKGAKLDEDNRFSFTTISKDATPVFTIDYVNEQLTGFEADARYKIVEEDEMITGIERLDISDRIEAGKLDFTIVKLPGNNGNAPADPVDINLPARPTAPSGLAVNPASNDTAADGEITGVNDTMEYSLDNGTTWIKVPEEGITKLAKGAEVLVRTAATEKSFRSKEVKLIMTDRPVVVDVTTSDSAPRDGQIAITFNKPMKKAPGKVTLGDIELDAGEWNDDGTIYTVDYTGLEDSTMYQITISGFTDEADSNKMADNTEFEITIGDHEGPEVTEMTPKGSNVSITTDKLVVTFNEAVKIDSGTVEAEGLTLTNPTGSDSLGNKIITYDLSGLERNQTYLVKIAGFTDIAGNVMKETTRDFSTERSTYKVAFDKGASDATGEMGPQTLTYGGDAIELPGNTFQRTGYHFTGWKGSDGKDYTDKQSVKDLTEEHQAKITLTAQWAANSYKARFDANQGTGTIAEQTFEYGGSCVLPTEGCTREGYRLVGWSTLPTPTAETTYELGATIPWHFDRDTTFYAVWQEEFTVSFDPDNGEDVTEQKVLAGEFVTPPANDPVKAYHSFGGWFFDGSLYNFGLPVHSNLNLIANWQKVYHTVTFDANGGTGGTKLSVMSGTTVAAPEVIYYGHRLIGWSTSQTGGALWDFNTEITADETLYAQWEAIPKYTLDFEVNGGSPITSVTDFEDTDIKLSRYQTTRDGYTFEGWYSDSALTVQVTQITLTDHQTVYAKWQEITDTDRYTLSFNSNGGSGIAQGTYDDGEVVQLGGFTPTREGYTFDGWYDNAGLTGGPISTVTMDQHRTVYAKWTAETYQVTIHLDGGTGDDSPRTATFDDSFTFPTADGYAKEGHQLIGWEIGTDRYEEGKVLERWFYAGDQTMTAIWAKNSYAIQFDSRGGTGVETQYIQHGERVIEPSAPTRDGFTFTGWYLTKDASSDPVDFESYTATDDTVFYAGWESTVEYYLVHFQSRDDHKVKTIQVRPGEKAPVPESWTWEGYTFEGWFTPEGDSIEVVGINEETTFEARWKAIEYKVTLRNPYGKDETISYSRDDLKTFPIPERRGYTFGGWQEVSNTRATGEIHPDTSGMIGDYVLEAKWDAITYSIIFDTAGGENISPIGFTVEDGVDSLPKPTRDGYIFQGWYDADGKEVTSIAKDTIGNQPLTARWLVDKTKLEALAAEEAEKKRSADSYTANSWKVYEEALAHAQTILDKEDATPQEVTEALAGLQAAIKQLTEKGAVVQPDPVKPDDGGAGSGTTKQPSGGETTKTVTTPTTVKRVNQSTGQSSQRKTLAQTGEKETALYLILGLAIVGFVIPAWKKNRDAMK